MLPTTVMPRIKIIMVAAVALAGCGTLVTDRYSGLPVAVLEGQLVAGPDTHIEGQISMAIFWVPLVPPAEGTSESAVPWDPEKFARALDAGVIFLEDFLDAGSLTLPDGGTFEHACTSLPPPFRFDMTLAQTTSQAVVFEQHFPIKVRIPLATGPLPSSQLDLATLGSEGKVSIGVVVAYGDSNGNGAFDFGDLTSDPEPIHAMSISGEGSTSNITGPEPWWTVVFLDSPNPPPPALGLPASTPRGFSVNRRSLTGQMEVLPISTPFHLIAAEASSPIWFLACHQVRSTTTSIVAAPPPGVLASCINRTSRSYTWSSTAIDHCNFNYQSGRFCLPPGADRPPDWPCQ